MMQKMSEMNLKPMGAEGFLYSVPGTVNDECPDGITNLIGAVEGSDETLKDEYILLSAHLDGPNNEGPSMSEGNLQTDDSYDDAGACAALLLSSTPRVCNFSLRLSTLLGVL